MGGSFYSPKRSVPARIKYGNTRHHLQEDKDKIRRINHSAKDQAEGLPGGVGRPPGSAEPSLVPVQVHFEEE